MRSTLRLNSDLLAKPAVEHLPDQTFTIVVFLSLVQVCVYNNCRRRPSCTSLSGVEKPCCIDTDAAATESYADFEREITEWSTSARVGGVQRVRTDMAAHLSEK